MSYVKGPGKTGPLSFSRTSPPIREINGKIIAVGSGKVGGKGLAPEECTE